MPVGKNDICGHWDGTVKDIVETKFCCWDKTFGQEKMRKVDSILILEPFDDALWFNYFMMGRTGETKILNQGKGPKSLDNRYVAKTRLNLHDLLQRRTEEKKVDKKNNLLIFSGVSAVAAVVLVILSL